MRESEREETLKKYFYSLRFSFRWFCTRRPLVYEVCNVSFENVLVALEHEQRSVLDLMQGYLCSSVILVLRHDVRSTDHSVSSKVSVDVTESPPDL